MLASSLPRAALSCRHKALQRDLVLQDDKEVVSAREDTPPARPFSPPPQASAPKVSRILLSSSVDLLDLSNIIISRQHMREQPLTTWLTAINLCSVTSLHSVADSSARLAYLASDELQAAGAFEPAEFRGLVFHDGVDAVGRPVIVVNAAAAGTKVSRKAACAYMLQRLEPIVVQARPCLTARAVIMIATLSGCISLLVIVSCAQNATFVQSGWDGQSSLNPWN